MLARNSLTKHYASIATFALLVLSAQFYSPVTIQLLFRYAMPTSRSRSPPRNRGNADGAALRHTRSPRRRSHTRSRSRGGERSQARVSRERDRRWHSRERVRGGERREGNQDGDRRNAVDARPKSWGGRSAAPPQNASWSVLPPPPFPPAAPYGAAPPPLGHLRPDREGAASAAVDAIGELKTLGALDLLVGRLPEHLLLELVDSLFRNLDDVKAARIAAGAATDQAFQKICKHLQTTISKWTLEQRSAFFVLPAGLDPNMQGGSKDDRLKNFGSLQEEVRARFLPITSTEQQRYVQQFKFKYVTMNQKSSRRYWDTIREIPWKVGTAEWAQFRKFIKEFAFDPNEKWDHWVDQNAMELEKTWQKLLGEDTYADEFEKQDEEDADQVASDAAASTDDNSRIEYAAIAITKIHADTCDWEDTEVDIKLGEEVAVLEVTGEWKKILSRAVVGWTAAKSLARTPAPETKRFINAPNDDIELRDDGYNKVDTKLKHTHEVYILGCDGDWCRITCPSLPEPRWIASRFLTETKPAGGKDGKGKGSKGNKGIKGKGAGKIVKNTINDNYSEGDFEQEKWPKFLFTGQPQALGKLNAEAARRLNKAITSASAPKCKESKQLATDFSHALDRLFPNDMGAEDRRWQPIKKVAADIKALDKHTQWNRRGVLDTLKTFFMRLKCLEDLEPSI